MAVVVPEQIVDALGIARVFRARDQRQAARLPRSAAARHGRDLGRGEFGEIDSGEPRHRLVVVKHHDPRGLEDRGRQPVEARSGCPHRTRGVAGALLR